MGGGRDGHPQDEDRAHYQGEQGELRQDGESREGVRGNMSTEYTRTGHESSNKN